VQWITRVPATLNEAQAVLAHVTPDTMPPFTDGYRSQEVSSTYGGITQRWLVVYAEARQKRGRRTVDQQVQTQSAAEQQAFGQERKPNVTVVEQRAPLKHALIDHVRQGRQPNQADLHNAEACRKQYLADMKTQGRGDVEVGVDMVHVVEPPEPWDHMVCQVPVVEGEIHQQEGQSKAHNPTFRIASGDVMNIALRKRCPAV